MSQIAKPIVFVSLLLLFAKKGTVLDLKSMPNFVPPPQQFDMYHITTYVKHESAKMIEEYMDH